MAGRGPAPAENRRRSNEPARGEWIDLPLLDPKKPVLPALPKRAKGDGPWSARTRSAWKAWREDPATTQYGPAEVQAAIDLAYLHDEWARGGGSKIAVEVRQRMDGLGLTPKGKRDLRWRAASAVGEPDGPRARRGGRSSANRMRSRLRLVE
jgi:hypothetical protein